jgi:YfiH family protein
MFMTPPKPNDAFEWAQAAPGLVLRCRPLARLAAHLFTTSAVQLRDSAEEWQRVAAAMDVRPESIRLIRQVHGTAVAVAGRHGADGTGGLPVADAVVSDDPELAIAVRVADCAPILLADRRHGAVAATHAGWRGAQRNVARAAVAAMRERFGSDPADLVAAIGPSLGSCCGEMGPEVVDAFAAAGHGRSDIERWFTPGPRGRPHFDLPLANRDQLARSGVPADAIHASGLCTRCRPDVFHSYRAEGAAAGRMAGVIRARG